MNLALSGSAFALSHGPDELSGMQFAAPHAVGFEIPDLGRMAAHRFSFLGLGAVSWLTMARIVRGQVLSLRTRAFVEASRALGAGGGWIIFRHIIPTPPMASWGSRISEAVFQINPIGINWWLIVFPGGALSATLVALNFVGDGLRDAWNVKVR